MKVHFEPMWSDVDEQEKQYNAEGRPLAVFLTETIEDEEYEDHVGFINPVFDHNAGSRGRIESYELYLDVIGEEIPEHQVIHETQGGAKREARVALKGMVANRKKQLELFHA